MVAYFNKSDKLIGMMNVADKGSSVLRSGGDAADFVGKGFSLLKIPSKLAANVSKGLLVLTIAVGLI